MCGIMKLIDATDLDYKELICQIRIAEGDCKMTGCCGQRFIGTGMSHKRFMEISMMLLSP